MTPMRNDFGRRGRAIACLAWLLFAGSCSAPAPAEHFEVFQAQTFG
jgi:hypothetical protein